MIQVVLGPKGSGKTKRLIDLANDALKVETGNIAFIDDDTRYMYDLRHEIRFINASEYSIKGADALYGMLCGILSVDFDISVIFIDPLLKLMKNDMDQVRILFERLDSLCKTCKFVIAYSGDEEGAPEYIRHLAI
jgi:energy-coupling factor transporter ATP-binding protein EcfA2